VDETVARAGMIPGVASAMAAITEQLQPVDFAHGWQSGVHLLESRRIGAEANPRTT